MNNVSFNEERNYSNNFNKTEGISGWLIKKGIVKDNKAAQYLLLGVIVVALVLTYFLVNGNSELNSRDLSNEEKIESIKESNLPFEIKQRQIDKMRNN